MEKITIQNVALDFGGFYNSVHSDLMDSELETILETEDLTYDNISDYISWKDIHLEYSKRLVVAFNNKFDLSLKFEELIQPREYNFHTDQILVEMSMQDYNFLWLNINQDEMLDKINKATTAVSGYMPLYNSSEILDEPQFIAEFLLDFLMEDDNIYDWFYEDNWWFYGAIDRAIEKFREKEDK